MSDNNLTSIILFLGVCILISLGVGYLLVEHVRLLEKFSVREGMADGEVVLYFFYSPRCRFSERAQKVWEQVRDYPAVRKVVVDCSDPKNKELCDREGIEMVPTFKLVSPRITRRIHDWRSLDTLIRTIDEAINPVPVQVALQ